MPYWKIKSKFLLAPLKLQNLLIKKSFCCPLQRPYSGSLDYENAYRKHPGPEKPYRKYSGAFSLHSMRKGQLDTGEHWPVTEDDGILRRNFQIISLTREILISKQHNSKKHKFVNHQRIHRKYCFYLFTLTNFHLEDCLLMVFIMQEAEMWTTQEMRSLVVVWRPLEARSRRDQCHRCHWVKLLV